MHTHTHTHKPCCCRAFLLKNTETRKPSKNILRSLGGSTPPLLQLVLDLSLESGTNPIRLISFDKYINKIRSIDMNTPQVASNSTCVTGQFTVFGTLIWASTELYNY